MEEFSIDCELVSVSLIFLFFQTQRVVTQNLIVQANMVFRREVL